MKEQERMEDSKTLEFAVERVFNASPADLFDDYVDPQMGRVLFAADDTWRVDVKTDLRVGGLWTISMEAPSGPSFRESNEFREIDRPRRLAFESTLHTPDGSSVVRDVEATFEPLGPGKTLMRVRQTGFPSMELRDLVASGVATMFDRLGESIQARPLSPMG
jgi:uncharacterized protein YndB with AHSA1/START domain